ncbi:xylose isomerase [Pseudodesulfovibrio sediminis]|uniref:Xylose isomerase n=1 Tax=Pseudodesulfovibrio sediminis TaxID=2810563 RepID=A0ABN6ETQ6_9BACT|nr:xylose isomerase [Pseudodesulfovibrio sediminis]BCS89731.1 xylose isomerase 2 [Pseudodesulfovibrio sediminis]
MNEFFPKVKKIEFEGRDSTNPLAFKFYDESRVVAGKTMKEYLRFAVCYWHTFKSQGGDPFGAPTFERDWNQGTPMEVAEKTLAANFEFITKLGAPYYCFHDRDISPEGETFSESCSNLETIVGKAKGYQEDTGVQLLWGTANLFSHPRYMHGAASNPDPHVVACCAMQVRQAIAATQELGGQNYVFWGGREGYETLLNTDMKRERAQMAAFFHMCVDYAKKIGFTGQFLIEPKPKEPTKHQYDYDSSSVLSFLREFDLIDHFKLNIEANHATLAGHSFAHDLAVAAEAGKLGSIDANTGDPLLGWDTDQFPTDINDVTRAMLVIIEAGGLGSGGLNFDAKLRRGSIDTEDMFHAHIGGMDTFARGLLTAQALIEDGRINEFKANRYAGWDTGFGKSMLDGNETLESMEAKAMELGEPKRVSGKQEMLENILINAI